MTYLLNPLLQVAYPPNPQPVSPTKALGSGYCRDIYGENPWQSTSTRLVCGSGLMADSTMHSISTYIEICTPYISRIVSMFFMCLSVYIGFMCIGVCVRDCAYYIYIGQHTSQAPPPASTLSLASRSAFVLRFRVQRLLPQGKVARKFWALRKNKVGNGGRISIEVPCMLPERTVKEGAQRKRVLSSSSRFLGDTPQLPDPVERLNLKKVPLSPEICEPTPAGSRTPEP